MNRFYKLFTVVILSLALLSPSLAKDEFVDVPSVSGTILDCSSQPIEYALVVVTILGSHQKAETAFGDIFKLSVLHDMTDKDGKFTIASDHIDLIDAAGKKAFLVGCRIEVTQKDYLPLRMDIANPSDSNSGVISIFLNSALQHNGSFFGAITAGVDAVKSHSFTPQYVKSLAKEPLIMTTEAQELSNSNEKSDTIVQGDSYSAAVVNKFHEINKRNDLKKSSSTAQKINRFNKLYQD